MVMEQIDESKRKPRRTKGTPSYYYRNRFAYAFLATGTALFAAFYFTPIYRVANEKLGKALFHPTQEELERRALFNFPAARTSTFIKETIEDRDNLYKQR